MLDERLGKIHFWLMFIGFNLTFGPFHILGLQGMPRRIYTYPSNRGWDFWNFFATIGSFVIALSVLVFIINLLKSRKGPMVGPDPWDARTLEWSVPSPPPEYNFAVIPLVTARDDLWHRKYEEDEAGRPVPRRRSEEHETADRERVLDATDGDTSGHGDVSSDTDHGSDGDGHEPHAGHGGEGEHHEHIHMPSPSYWPLVAAFGIPIICYGLIYKFLPVCILGGVWVLASLYSWALEPATAPPEPEPDVSTSTDLEPVSQAH
jgi:cytochrome c oxidase subunit 1